MIREVARQCSIAGRNQHFLLLQHMAGPFTATEVLPAAHRVRPGYRGKDPSDIASGTGLALTGCGHFGYKRGQMDERQDFASDLSPCCEC
ncbi:hypothetical protein RM96_14520 [Cupriavidus sp. IDO]|nr:hypothetical protein RM96_14520 [Cupriavidus sp. IDO]